ncbi:HlyD family efflux transporter periplasmic adaptor subunit [Aquabacterium sp.]|uniref:HlyD family secretion protein n=1 Tax=Aquabacterium sp. TaxID=1872578 RepID=UPI002BBF9E69|nr:HlyD family efflux transporter periplasmic adaptor subunit [Aquabacterium sp.]HSW08663.1 HlyD family efflux transporter periplasmic adaptor subunit [Aquabacterium sp.]
MNSAAQSPAAAPVPAPVPAPATRRKALLIVGGVLAVGGLAWGVWHMLALSRVESTDNAYVQGNVVQITPQVAGTVVSINVDDTDVVKAGQPLVRLDPADAQLALDQAQAQLGQTVREVRTLYANNSTLKAQISLREAEVARAQADLARAQDDVARRKPLVASGAVGQEEFSHATAQLSASRSAVVAAQSSVVAAQEQLSSNQSMTEGTPVDQHPSVQRAASQVREAYLALKRADLLAPLDGVVARRSVQIGQRVAAGAPLMTVVALDKLWVDANFKEGQLQRMHIGQSAKLVADVYGRKVEYHGRVAGLGAGTGAAFALLPAQNATGNWIKIVQRVPVRIQLDPKELAAHPLRVGLSMDVTVDVSDAKGPPLTATARTQPVAQTTVFDALAREADAEVARIVKANLGGRLRARS